MHTDGYDMHWCNFICLFPTTFRCIQRSVFFYLTVHAHNPFIEEDGSCWINWDKSQLRPQRVFKKTTRNYKDLEEGCWTRLLEKKMLNESELFDSLNAQFQNNLSLGPNG